MFYGFLNQVSKQCSDIWKPTQTKDIWDDSQQIHNYKQTQTQT